MSGLLTIELPPWWPTAVQVAQTLRSADGVPLDLSPGAGSAVRDALRRRLGLQQIGWLHQVHGQRVVSWPRAESVLPEADAGMTQQTGLACAVLTADCLPVLLARRDGTAVAAVHAGWRGMAADIIESAVQRLAGARTGAEEGVHGSSRDAELVALLGPAIGQAAFEVGPEVRDALIAPAPSTLGSACLPGRDDRWHVDLAALARQRLERVGVTQVLNLRHDVHADAERFYSHRRDGAAGRQATLIWISPGLRSSAR